MNAAAHAKPGANEDWDLLSGWGRAAPSAARRVPVARAAELDAVFDAPGPVLARGLGRAYGDAAQLAGGTVIDCTGLSAIRSFDPAGPVVRAEAGCSLAELLSFLVPRGFFVPVTPGTAHVTLGGAIAADVHGKNHHRDGSIARYVRQLVLHTPTGRFDLQPDEDPELFSATLGGMGLTGFISEVTLAVIPIESAYVSVDTERTDDLEGCLERLSSGDDRYRYSVAWVDAARRGRHLGRAVITRGDHAPAPRLGGSSGRSSLAYETRERLSLFATPPVSLVRPATIRAFNEAWFRKAPRHRTGELQAIASFFYPLDAVGAWNRLYGPAGFTQYQFVVPFDASRVVQEVLEDLQAAGCLSSLAVLKRFGESSGAPLSFPSPGWTLALDLPLGSFELASVLDRCDDRIVEAGGRVYLAKDGRLRPEVIAAMYPRLEAFRAVCRRVDPNGRITSDLARRLGLKEN